MWKELTSKYKLQLAGVFIIIAQVLFLLNPYSAIAFFMYLTSLFVLYKISIRDIIKLGVAGVSLAVIMPFAGMTNSYYLDVATQLCIYGALAIGLNVVVGFAGLLDLGYVGFYAAGAYFYGIFATAQANNFIPETLIKFPLSGMWFWPFLVFSMILAAICGVLLGFPVLRLRGDYLAIVTLGFGEIIRIILNNLDKPINFTNGPKGLSPVQPPELFGMILNEPIHYYFIVLVLLIISIIVANRLNDSRIGRAWTAIREDEVAARTMGIPLVKMKLLAFAIGASFAGTMGVIFAAKQTFIDPSSFSFMESIAILAMVIMGGMGNVAGAVIGAAAVIVLQLQVLKEFSDFLLQLSASGILHIPAQLNPAKYERLIFGLILILMCIFRPQGMIPGKRKLGSLKNFNLKKNPEKRGDDVGVA